MNSVKVSVIIPVYNVELYLRRSMDCLMKQTMEDLEFICIDDCSTDNSLSILREYEAKDKRFKIIALDKNQGVAVARNKGLEFANGEYIGFIDPDDAIDLNYYEELYKKAKEGDYDIAKGQMKEIYANGKITIRKDSENIKKYGLYAFSCEYTCAIYKSSIIKDNNIKFKEELLHAEDTLFLTEMLLKSKNIILVDNIFYYYNRREGSLNSKKLSAIKLRAALSSLNLSLQAINNSAIFKDNKKGKDYKLFYNDRYKWFLGLFYKSMDEESRLLCAKEIIEGYYLCRNREIFKENYYKKILKYIKAKDTIGLEKFMSKYNNLQDFKKREVKFIEKIFSIKNDSNKHKVIRILGLKIKFKNYKKTNKNPKIKVDVIVSFGQDCRVAQALRRNKLRYFSTPFDWMMKYSLENVIDVLSSKGEKFFKNIEEYPEKSSNKSRYIICKDTGMVSMHDFSNNLSLENAQKLFRKVMSKRFHRMDKILKRAKSICIVSSRQIKIEEIKKFVYEFLKLYTFEKLYFISAFDWDNEEKFVETKFDDNVTVFEYYFNDVHKNGNDPKTNPRFWHKNVEYWDKILREVSLNRSFVFKNTWRDKIFKTSYVLKPNYVQKVIGMLGIKIKLKMKPKNDIFVIAENGTKKHVKSIKGIKFFFDGGNSTVNIYKPIPKFCDCEIHLKNDNFISIGCSKYKINKLNIFSSKNNSKVIIGNNLSVQGKTEILLNSEDDKQVLIGNDCMFGSDIFIRTGDVHSIFDKTGNVINMGKNVVIGNKVWIAYGATVLKGVNIGDGCIIGTQSLVTKNCEQPNSIYAGNPATLKKQDIYWDRRNPDKLAKVK